MSLIGRALSGMKLRQALRKWGIAAVAMVGLSTGQMLATPVQARPATTAIGATVTVAQLPPQAQSTYQRVLNGGPFPYTKDGIVFGNRERRLPIKNPASYYREYTIPTPGSKDRGARRIVCGGKPPARPEACFYTDDHYASFRRIVQ